MQLYWTLVLLGLITLSCAPAPPRKPQKLIDLPASPGVAPVAVTVQAGGARRRALVQRSTSHVFLPRRGLLTFGMAAAARGELHVTIRSEGRVLGRRSLDPRASAYHPASVPFDGPGRPGPLEVDLRLTDSGGRELPQPSAGPAAVTEPTLFDRDAVRGVVLVSIDTLRRDHLGLYGYGRPTTPELDRWSRRAVVFRDAVSVSAWTLPAHLSILTSVTPSRHGGVDGHHGFNRSVPTLAQTLRRAGFTTHAITSQLYVSPAYGLDAGFDTFDYAEPRGAEEVAARAIATLDAHRGRPFFLFLHFYDVHWPYDAPPEARRPFGARPASEIGSRPPAETRPADPRPLLDAYDAEIRHVDRHLGRVLEHLDSTGWSDHTLVAITSDHGEEFGEHGGYEHLRTLYEEVIRIPMLVRAPRAPAREVSSQVDHLDLAPTVLAAVGLPPEPSHQGRDLLGTLDPREAFGETELGGDPGGPKVRRAFLRDGAGKSKLIVGSDRRTGLLLAEEWFDLTRDPGERTSLAPPAAAARGWRDRLAARRSRGPVGRPVTVTEDDEARLAALGYIGR